MTALRWVRAILAFGALGALIGYRVADELEYGLFIGLAIGTLIKTFSTRFRNT